MGENLHTMKRNTKYMLIARQEVGLKVSTAKTNYMPVFHEQSKGQDQNFKTANKSFESMESFKYFGTTPTNQNYTHEKKFNPLKPELNPICYMLALLGAHHFLHVSRIRVKSLIFRLLMS